MQTKKFFVVIGAAVMLAGPLTTVAGPDTDAQAKLREAMRAKMEELNAKTAPAPTPAPVPATATAAPTIQPIERPATVVVPVPVEPVPVPIVTNPEPVVAKPAPIVVKPAPVVPPVSPKIEAKSAPVFSDVPEQNDGQDAQLLEAVRAKLAAEKASKAASVAVPAAPVAPEAPTAPQPAVVVAPKPAVSVPLTAGMEAPASPLTGTKQERLAELLRRYRGDEITPQEYHTQRAKIIAE